MTVNVTPLHDRVLVRRLEERGNREGRHHHPRHGQGEAPGGRSDGRRSRKDREKGERVPLDVKAGDRILFGKYSGNDINDR